MAELGLEETPSSLQRTGTEQARYVSCEGKEPTPRLSRMAKDRHSVVTYGQRPAKTHCCV